MPTYIVTESLVLRRYYRVDAARQADAVAIVRRGDLVGEEIEEQTFSTEIVGAELLDNPDAWRDLGRPYDAIEATFPENSA